MLSELNDVSMSITRQRRVVDRTFSEWYDLRKELEEFIKEHEMDMPVYRQLHFFTKAQKRPHDKI